MKLHTLLMLLIPKLHYKPCYYVIIKKTLQSMIARGTKKINNNNNNTKNVTLIETIHIT